MVTPLLVGQLALLPGCIRVLRRAPAKFVGNLAQGACQLGYALEPGEQ
jgi:hypothetical protein